MKGSRNCLARPARCDSVWNLERILLAGVPPSPTRRATGCGIRGRCPRYAALSAPRDADRRIHCERQAPTLTAPGPGRAAVACRCAELP
ncbi:hypothetical protein ACO0M4_14965 [Streptomyces sp. RGM 3693]|uniref:hypothetical protein n=1 Tax=Streptomyces sp. RGM 3693 TaxID=3413284 RepID=UPI003D28F98F